MKNKAPANLRFDFMKKKYASQYISKEKADKINDKDSEENASVESPIINLEAQNDESGLRVQAQEYNSNLKQKNSDNSANLKPKNSLNALI